MINDVVANEDRSKEEETLSEAVKLMNRAATLLIDLTMCKERFEIRISALSRRQAALNDALCLLVQQLVERMEPNSILKPHHSILGKLQDAVSESQEFLDQEEKIFDLLSGPVSPDQRIHLIPVHDLGLSQATLSCLQASHITEVGFLLEMDYSDLLAIKNVGVKRREEIVTTLRKQLGFERSYLASTIPASTN